MPLLRINVGEDGLELHENRHGYAPILSRALRHPGPVIVMVHGYKYQPYHVTCCPHRSILGMRTRRDSRTARSWPRGLGFGSGVSREGLGIAYGWQARGTIWQAYAQARRAGVSLAALIAEIHCLAPDRKIHALAHSLGARVMLSALPLLPPCSLDRVILLSGAEFASMARAALNSPAGQTAEFINITSRENDLFDFMLERLVAPPHRNDQVLGNAMPVQDNTLSIQMDCPDTLMALLRCGFRIEPPSRRVCHWSSYMRPGVFNLYRSLLRRSDAIDLDHLKQVLPQHSAPRWSRILPLPVLRTRALATPRRNDES